MLHSSAGGEEGEDKRMVWSDPLPGWAADQKNPLLKVGVDPDYLPEFERRLGVLEEGLLKAA